MSTTISGTVVFMGAGASKAFGLPLTAEILPKIVERLREGSNSLAPLFPGRDRKRLTRELRGALSTLYPGFRLDDTAASLPNITDVLSLLDHLLFYEQPAALRFQKERLQRARRLVERAMMEVLLDGDLSRVMDELADVQNYSEQLPRINIARRASDSEAAILKDFLKWLHHKRIEDGPVTLVTTNYDVAIETPLYDSMGHDKVSRRIDFGFDWRDPDRGTLIPRPLQPEWSLYKLHGSLNWLRCDLCGQVYVNSREVIAYLSFNGKQAWANTCECGSFPLRHLIVAPSMVRDVRDSHLLNVWRCATEALRTAKEWYIVGYSLPSEDLAIRSMLLRALGARGLKGGEGELSGRSTRPGPRVTVVQKGGAARSAYAAMFPKFEYLDGGLEELISSRRSGARKERRRPKAQRSGSRASTLR